MKNFLQILIFFFLIFISIFFYSFYFSSKKISHNNFSDIKNGADDTGIKNLEYRVFFDNEKSYKISSVNSYLQSLEDQEIINMQEVVATINNKNIITTITSNKALYNNSDYNTKFFDNVKIKYLNNIITSDQLSLDFDNNLIKISGNVKYNSMYSQLFADNVYINIETKIIDIFMDGDKNKVKIITVK